MNSSEFCFFVLNFYICDLFHLTACLYRDEDVPTSSDSKLPSNSENDAEAGPESVIITRSSASADTCSWKPENCDAPKGMIILFRVVTFSGSTYYFILSSSFLVVVVL